MNALEQLAVDTSSRQPFCSRAEVPCLMRSAIRARVGGCTHRRLDAALQQHEAHGAPILLTGGWTPHRPALIAPSGQMLHESTALAQYLLARGVSPNKLYKEWAVRVCVQG